VHTDLIRLLGAYGAYPNDCDLDRVLERLCVAHAWRYPGVTTTTTSSSRSCSSDDNKGVAIAAAICTSVVRVNSGVIYVVHNGISYLASTTSWGHDVTVN
jgi:hypothetical protein